MINSKVYGIHGKGRILCDRCAERLYGDNLDMYLTDGNIQVFSESDRQKFASKGLLCDECLSWIFQPDRTKNPHGLVDPNPEKQLRLPTFWKPFRM
jgi:hypothetical protein